MESQRWASWLALVANLAVVVGLVLVMVQMRQNAALTRVQVINDYFNAYVGSETVFAGTDPTAIWAKSILEPENLTLAEMRALEIQTYSPLSRWIGLYWMSEAGIADDEVWKGQIRADTSFYFGTAYGRAWWAHFSDSINPSFMPQVVREEIDRELAKVEDNWSLHQYEAIRADLIKRTKEAAVPRNPDEAVNQPSS